ncbi:Rieske (2Fe-2S) protein [Sphingomonas jaspsi]|uniref:Rieske (2Fe-2S) protein n=1 Tax=Sphingomonas jaspsi TaxID=392409 RepID=UPI0004ADA622|nr:Rieske 2Fe-2S domain-containing protein [Sphingomonas jaspsi]
MAKTTVCALDDIPDNGNRAFDVGGTKVLLARTSMGLFAVGAICSHQYSELEGAKQKACFLFCPLHGLRFDLRSGKPAGTLTDQPLPTYAVGIEDGMVWVDPDKAGA